MEFSSPTLWWILAGVLVAVEMVTGTVYLLALATGAAAGALAAHAGLATAAQITVAALIGGGATAAWHLRRARHPRSAPAQANPDVILDIGQRVNVDTWHADGTARVTYRGSTWTVQHRGAQPPSPGVHVIVAVQGNRLDVQPAPAT